MSGIRALTEHHTLEIETDNEASPEDYWVFISETTFTCTAPEDAACRTYPPSCGCETITEDPQRPGLDDAGHEFETGQECWVKVWFDVGPETCEYIGDDADSYYEGNLPPVERRGHVEIMGFDECPEWRWAQ